MNNKYEYELEYVLTISRRTHKNLASVIVFGYMKIEA